MPKYTLLFKVFTTALVGFVSVFVGLNIISTGMLRHLLHLGNERYFVGGMFIIFGVWSLSMCLKYFAIKRKNKREI